MTRRIKLARKLLAQPVQIEGGRNPRIVPPIKIIPVRFGPGRVGTILYCSASMVWRYAENFSSDGAKYMRRKR